MGEDVWFSFVAACTGPHAFLTCGADYDTVIQVFDGTGGCGALVSVGCNDDAGGSGPCAGSLQSRLVANLTLGTTYYIRVGGWNGANGNFPLRILSSTGLGTIGLATLSLCQPLGLSLSVTGDPNIGGTVTATMVGFTGLPFVTYGFAPAAPILSPVCPCLLLTSGASWQFTPSLPLFIPCNPIFLGTQLQAQGLDFLPTAPATCTIPAGTGSSTDIWQITVG